MSNINCTVHNSNVRLSYRDQGVISRIGSNTTLGRSLSVLGLVQSFTWGTPFSSTIPQLAVYTLSQFKTGDIIKIWNSWLVQVLFHNTSNLKRGKIILRPRHDIEAVSSGRVEKTGESQRHSTSKLTNYLTQGST